MIHSHDAHIRVTGADRAASEEESMIDSAMARRLITELVAEKSRRWNEEGDERAEELAVFFGVTRHLAWLTGTGKYWVSAGVAASADPFRRPHSALHVVDIGWIEKRRLDAMETQAPMRAEQTVLAAAQDTNLLELPGFEATLRRHTWNEMTRLASESSTYVQAIDSVTSRSERARSTVAEAFECGLNKLERVAFLALRRLDDEQHEVAGYDFRLSAAEIGLLARKQPERVIEARSRAQRIINKARESF